MDNIKKEAKRFWNWLWHSESWLSYVVFLILVFIIIKFIFLPGLGLLFGTKLPLAIVESCSMYHEGNFFTNYDDWWGYWQQKYQNHNITKEQFKNFNFARGFNKGDILVILGTKPEKLKIGDVIIFSSPDGRAIIHRIINIKNENGRYIFSTLGDHNTEQLSFEKEIDESRIIGRASLKIIPYAGWVKLIFFEPGRQKSERGFCKSNY